jgi:uncharacterized repeat protein (TIGR03803 family)
MRTLRTRIGLFAVIVLVLTLHCVALWAATPKTVILYNFGGVPDGFAPIGDVISDSSGNLYGVTGWGGDGDINCRGVQGCGIVFELIAPSSPKGTWKEQILHTFTAGADGAQSSTLVMDPHGNLYATSPAGGDLTSSLCTDEFNVPIGCGVVYELSQQHGVWTQTVLHTFEGPDGAEPSSALVFDTQGNLYGSTQIGGANGGGTVFEMSPSGDGTWTESVVYSFDSPRGVGIFTPAGALVFDSSANLYGTAMGADSNGDGGYGVIYQLQSGTRQQNTLYSFCCGTEPYNPHGGLTIDVAGNLYGTTQNGGAVNVRCLDGCGTIYELSLDNGVWSYNSLFEFDNGQGVSFFPTAPPLPDSAGNLYGTAESGGGGCGAVWRLTTGTKAWAELDYPGSHDPPGLCGPNGTPIVGKFGAFYTTSAAGGPKNKLCSHGCGTVFAVYP